MADYNTAKLEERFLIVVSTCPCPFPNATSTNVAIFFLVDLEGNLIVSASMSLDEMQAKRREQIEARLKN